MQRPVTSYKRHRFPPCDHPVCRLERVQRVAAIWLDITASYGARAPAVVSRLCRFERWAMKTATGTERIASDATISLRGTGGGGRIGCGTACLGGSQSPCGLHSSSCLSCWRTTHGRFLDDNSSGLSGHVGRRGGAVTPIFRSCLELEQVALPAGTEIGDQVEAAIISPGRNIRECST